MKQLDTPEGVRAALRPYAQRGERIGFVPTMGALHDGHLSLIERARVRADRVVASIFVNPTQFGPNEDLSRYPRDLEGDRAKLAAAGCDFLFVPAVEAIYPPGFETYVEVPKTASGLCGASRPGHFRGVATVVLKLLLIVAPNVAVFGEKDYQQLSVIRRMLSDLALDVEILSAPIYRDADGLAASSRNVYLSPAERQRALALSRGLDRAEQAFRAGENQASVLVERARSALAEVELAPEYLELRAADDLASLETVARPAVMLVAAKLGSTRLIDNRILARS